MTDLEQTRVFVAHLRIEHRRLHELLRQVEALWSADRDAASAIGEVPRVVEGLEKLREDLARHFAQEEEGGCLEEAVCHRPSLSAQVNQVELEHPLLLDQLDRIIGRARNGLRVDEAAGKFEREFKRFAHQLHAHEAAENSILMSAFGADAEELETN